MNSTRRYTVSERFIPLHAARGSMLSISCRRMKRSRSLSATSSPPGGSPEQKRALAQSIPVAIVGAGPAGLTLSSLLSRFGVPSILLEKTSALPTHPQAHFINVRTMEIMRNALGGLDRAVFEKCPPRDEWRDFIFCSSVLGRQLARVNNFSQEEAEERDRMSPTDVAHLSQNILLPLMLDDARQAAVRSCPSSQILFQAEVTSLRRNPHANLENAASPLELLLRRGHPSSAEIGAIGCDYIVAADGAGSSVRGAAGMGLSGRRELGHLVNVHFRCPGLGLLMKERGQQAGMLSFVYNEETISVLVAHNVQKGDWACQVPFFPPHQNAEWFTRERCLSIVQHAIGPGSKSLDIQICSVRPWTMNALVADEYLKFFCSDTAAPGDNSKGGVFLVGDAAHQFPPAGGFGLNTGVQDAHNLAWKLAAVHHNLAPPKLLRTYEQERRPVAMRNAALSVRNLKRSLRVMEALGVNPDVGASKAIMSRLIRSPMALNWSDGAYRVAASIWNPEERSENIIRLGRRQLRALRMEGHPYGDARVRELRRLLAEGGGLPLLFPEHDIGFIYREAAIPQSKSKNLDGAEALAIACPPLSNPGSSEFSVRPHGMNTPRSRIRVGGIMPHFILRLACDGGNIDAPSRPASLFSTVDLPDQLRESLGRDRACSLDSSAINHDTESRSKAASEAARVSLASVLVVAPPSVDTQPFGCNANSLSGLWRQVALNVQQDLAASWAGKRSAIPCPLVIVLILPSPRAPVDEGNRRVVSGDTSQSSPEDCAQRYPINGKDSIRPIRARDLEVVARINHHRSDLSFTVTSDLIENNNLNELGMGGMLLLAMSAIDVSGGALVEAFASAGAEAVLIRPDGHVGWVAPCGTVSGEHGDPSLSLKSALNTLYSGQSIVP